MGETGSANTAVLWVYSMYMERNRREPRTEQLPLTAVCFVWITSRWIQGATRQTAGLFMKWNIGGYFTGSKPFKHSWSLKNMLTPRALYIKQRQAVLLVHLKCGTISERCTNFNMASVAPGHALQFCTWPKWRRLTVAAAFYKSLLNFMFSRIGPHI